MKNSEKLSHICSSLSDEKRILALELLAKGKKLSHVSKELRLSRSGFQRYLNDFVHSGILRKSGDRGSYEITYCGRQFLGFLLHVDSNIEGYPKEEVKERVRESLFGAGLTKEELMKMVEEIKMEKENKVARG